MKTEIEIMTNEFIETQVQNKDIANLRMTVLLQESLIHQLKVSRQQDFENNKTKSKTTKLF